MLRVLGTRSSPNETYGNVGQKIIHTDACLWIELLWAENSGTVNSTKEMVGPVRR